MNIALKRVKKQFKLGQLKRFNPFELNTRSIANSSGNKKKTKETQLYIQQQSPFLHRGLNVSG